MLVQCHQAVFKTGATALAGLALFFGICATPSVSAEDTARPVAPLVDRSLTAGDIDPAIYFDFDDPSDPFGEIYEGFRARRASDMADASKPPPIEPYESVHLSRKMPWSALEDILPFDWETLREESPVAVAQFERVVRARLAFDHPDVKITQLMIGPGATLPGHAGGSPGFYYVIGGSGEITVEGTTHTVTPGTTVKLEPYDVRRLYAAPGESLRVIWVRWAPGGDQQYLAAGYYLTGANQHIQPEEAVLPADYHYWGRRLSTDPVVQARTRLAAVSSASSYAAWAAALEAARFSLGAHRVLYPDTPVFSHESDNEWITEEMLKGSGFFWAKDIASLGALAQRWQEVMRLKGFFRARRPDGGWDFNISQMVWGPHARYVEHSHSIPEFYYMMSGPVEHWVGDEKFTAMPGDIFMTNSYQTHQSRGIVDNMPFRNIGASWAPNGDRSVFKRPFYLVEPLVAQPEAADLGKAPSFH